MASNAAPRRFTIIGENIHATRTLARTGRHVISVSLPLAPSPRAHDRRLRRVMHGRDSFVSTSQRRLLVGEGVSSAVTAARTQRLLGIETPDMSSYLIKPLLLRWRIVEHRPANDVAGVALQAALALPRGLGPRGDHAPGSTAPAGGFVPEWPVRLT